MSIPTDEQKPTSDISEYLTQAKNEIHQRQQLFIAQKSYTDALKNEPAAGDTSPEAEDARRVLVETLHNLQNLEQLVSAPINNSSS